MSQEEFENRLQDLISEAIERNAPIYGMYSVRSPDPSTQDYEIQVVEVANRGFSSIDSRDE